MLVCSLPIKGRKRRARDVTVSLCFTCPGDCFSLLYLLYYSIFIADSTAKVTSAQIHIIKRQPDSLFMSRAAVLSEKGGLGEMK